MCCRRDLLMCGEDTISSGRLEHFRGGAICSAGDDSADGSSVVDRGGGGLPLLGPLRRGSAA